MKKKIVFGKDAARLLKLNEPGSPRFEVDNTPTRPEISFSKEAARLLKLDQPGSPRFKIDNTPSQHEITFGKEAAELLQLDGVKRPLTTEPNPTIDQVKKIYNKLWEKNPKLYAEELKRYLQSTIESGQQHVEGVRINETVIVNRAEDIFSFIGFKNPECNKIAANSILTYIDRYLYEYSFDCKNDFITSRSIKPCPREIGKIFKFLEQSQYFTKEDYQTVATKYIETLKLRGKPTKYNTATGLNYQDATILHSITKNFAKDGKSLDSIKELIEQTPFKKINVQKSEEMQKAEFDKQINATQQIINNPELAKTSNIEQALSSIKNRILNK